MFYEARVIDLHKSFFLSKKMIIYCKEIGSIII